MPTLNGLREDLFLQQHANSTDRELALAALQLIAESNTAADLTWMLLCGEHGFGDSWQDPSDRRFLAKAQTSCVELRGNLNFLCLLQLTSL
jgi:hypothetical protein